MSYHLNLTDDFADKKFDNTRDERITMCFSRCFSPNSPQDPGLKKLL